MRCTILTLLAVLGCKDPAPEPPAPPLPTTDGVVVIHRGAPPYQTLRYQLTKGAVSTSELVSDSTIRTDGTGSELPSLVFDLETTVEDVLSDGGAKLRIRVAQTVVRDRPGAPPSTEVMRQEAAALQGVVVRETLAPNGKLIDAQADTAALPTLSEKSRGQLDSLTQTLAGMAMQLPGEPVGAGAIWRERRSLPAGGIQATAELTYTIGSISGSTVGYESAGLVSGAPHTIEEDGVKVEVSDTRGHSRAKGTLDLARYAFAVTSSATFATTMNVIAPDEVPGAGTTAMEIVSAVELKPTEGLPASAPAPVEPPVAAATPEPAPEAAKPQKKSSRARKPSRAKPSSDEPTPSEPPEPASVLTPSKTNDAGPDVAPEPSGSNAPR